MLAGVCTFLNVYCTQPLLPLLREIFHASELQVSLTVSVTILATALTAPVVGLIAERRGRKKLIVPSLFLLTIPTALAATSTSLNALIFWRFAQGLFVPGVIAVMLAYVNEEWAGRGVGRALSSDVRGTVLGGFLGRFLAGVIATHWHWRATFLVLAALNLVGAFVVRAWLPLAKNFVRAEHLQQAIDHATGHLRNGRLLANFGMGATVLFALVGCFTYANFYLAATPYHLNSAQLRLSAGGGDHAAVRMVFRSVRLSQDHSSLLQHDDRWIALHSGEVAADDRYRSGSFLFGRIRSASGSHGTNGSDSRPGTILCSRPVCHVLLSGRKRGRHAHGVVLALGSMARLCRAISRNFVAEYVAGSNEQPSHGPTRLRRDRIGWGLKCGWRTVTRTSSAWTWWRNTSPTVQTRRGDAPRIPAPSRRECRLSFPSCRMCICARR
jgi:MFS family permease